jgi:monoamine oxidase
MGWPDAIEAYSVPGDAAGAVATFSIATPDTQSAIRRAWGAVRDRHPQVTFQGSFLHHDWQTYPYSKGTWACPRPAQQQGWHELSDAAPPFVFAGGDLSRRWFGWMDGAVTSGKDAASRTAAYLAGAVVPAALG